LIDGVKLKYFGIPVSGIPVSGILEPEERRVEENILSEE